MSEIEIPAGASPGVADIVRQFNDQDPAVRTWGESLAASAEQTASTSALLRRLTGELDALREQYNAVLLKRDELEATRTRQADEITRLRDRSAADVQRAAGYLSALTDMGKDYAALLVANDRLTKQLPDRDPAAEAHWIVARDGGRNCERCEGEVRRGEAYELQDGTGGLLLHIHCPRTEGRKRHARAYQLTDKGLAATAGIGDDRGY